MFSELSEAQAERQHDEVMNFSERDGNAELT